jgi:hypothetical protein
MMILITDTLVSVHINILNSKMHYSRKYATVKHKNKGGKAKCFTKKDEEDTLVTLQDFAGSKCNLISFSWPMLVTLGNTVNSLGL